MKILLRFFGFLFAAGTIVFIAGVTAAAGLLWHYSKDLPDYSQLQNYEPPVMTRVQAADGSLVAEYANERRLYLPIQAIPKLVTNAFIAAEDKSFYQHPGVDAYGIARAREFLTAAGATDICVNKPILYGGWHLLGTARMGTDPARSVVNEWGRAHDVKNLFIVDGSVFVTSGGVNPTSTIQAIALYVADQMKQRLANLFD